MGAGIYGTGHTMKLSNRSLICCLAPVLTMAVATTSFHQTTSVAYAARAKAPAFTLTSPTSGVVQPGETLTLTAAKGFKVKAGVSPYKFYIGNELVQPTFTGPVKREVAQLVVPSVPFGTYAVQITYQKSTRKPAAIVFSKDIVVGTSVTPPTGQGKITFTSNRDGNNEIYIMDANGANQVRLTSTPTEETWPVFSPDGSKIAFNSYRPGSNSVIYIMNSNGTGSVPLTRSTSDNYGPTFNRTGSKIAFTSSRDKNSEIYIMNPDGSSQTNLTQSNARDFWPVFSPDGSRIAFCSDRDGNNEIYTMNVDGSNVVRLTNSSSDDYGPSFSPDGSKITFTSDRDGNTEIYVMNANGSNPVRLTTNSTRDYGAVFSPDGSKIAFTSERSGNFAIYTMSANGTEQTRLTNNLALDALPSWVASVPGSMALSSYDAAGYSDSDYESDN
jgi:Tol biopolymer transport system component